MILVFFLLYHLEHIVLDEADEMLNMGFAEAIEGILKKVYVTYSYSSPSFSSSLY